MAFSSPSGRRGPAPGRRPAAPSPRVSAKAPLNEDRIRLERDLEEIKRKAAEIKKLEERQQRALQELPKKIEEQRRREEEAIHKRAALTATNDVIGRRRVDKRHSKIHANTSDRRMTFLEQRAMRIQALALCALLALILFMLWKSLP
jgi:hypothetical protein